MSSSHDQRHDRDWTFEQVWQGAFIQTFTIASGCDDYADAILYITLITTEGAIEDTQDLSGGVARHIAHRMHDPRARATIYGLILLPTFYVTVDSMQCSLRVHKLSEGDYRLVVVFRCFQQL